MKNTLMILILVLIITSFYSCASLKIGASGGIDKEVVKMYVYDYNNKMILGAKVEVETSIPPIFISSTNQYGFVLVRIKRLKYELPLLRVSKVGYKTHISKLQKTLDGSMKVILRRR